MLKTAESIIQKNKHRCFNCKRYGQMEEHHIFEGYANRKKSEKYGLKVYLCGETCHRCGKHSVHKDSDFSNYLKKIAEQKALDHYGWSIEDFIKIFGRNYL